MSRTCSLTIHLHRFSRHHARLRRGAGRASVQTFQDRRVSAPRRPGALRPLWLCGDPRILCVLCGSVAVFSLCGDHEAIGESTICSFLASHYRRLPCQYDFAAIVHATECAKPSCTVACGCWRLRRHSNQLVMWLRSSSPMPVGGSPAWPGSLTSVALRFSYAFGS